MAGMPWRLIRRLMGLRSVCLSCASRRMVDIEMEFWYNGIVAFRSVSKSVNGKCRMCCALDRDSEDGELSCFFPKEKQR